MDPTFLSLIKEIGFPGAVLIIAAWWFAPRFDKVFNATADQAVTLKVMDAKVEAHQGEIKQHLVEIKSKVDALVAQLAREEG